MHYSLSNKHNTDGTIMEIYFMGRFSPQLCLTNVY